LHSVIFPNHLRRPFCFAIIRKKNKSNLAQHRVGQARGNGGYSSRRLIPLQKSKKAIIVKQSKNPGTPPPY
jgi:hypothetical protein